MIILGLLNNWMVYDIMELELDSEVLLLNLLLTTALTFGIQHTFSLKYMTSGCKDIGISIFKLVASKQVVSVLFKITGFCALKLQIGF